MSFPLLWVPFFLPAATDKQSSGTPFPVLGIPLIWFGDTRALLVLPVRSPRGAFKCHYGASAKINWNYSQKIHQHFSILLAVIRWTSLTLSWWKDNDSSIILEALICQCSTSRALMNCLVLCKLHPAQIKASRVDGRTVFLVMHTATISFPSHRSKQQ